MFHNQSTAVWERESWHVDACPSGDVGQSLDHWSTNGLSSFSLRLIESFERCSVCVCGVCVRVKMKRQHSLVTVRMPSVICAEIWMRPLLSVWSVPHRLGTLATHRLWMFIIQSEQRHTKMLEIYPKITLIITLLSALYNQIDSSSAI